MARPANAAPRAAVADFYAADFVRPAVRPRARAKIAIISAGDTPLISGYAASQAQIQSNINAAGGNSFC